MSKSRNGFLHQRGNQMGKKFHLPPGKREQLLAAATAKLLQSCLTLCDPIDGSPPGSSVPGILQARILEWVAISFSKAWKGKVKVKLLRLSTACSPTLRDPMDCSLPGSSVHGIFQARVLEWVTISFSSSFWTPVQMNEYLSTFSLPPVLTCHQAVFILPWLSKQRAHKWIQKPQDNTL